MKTAIAFLLSLLLLLAGTTRAGDDLPDLERRFRAAFAPESSLDVRQAMVEKLADCGYREGLDLLFLALGDSRSRLAGLSETTRKAREALARFEEPIYRDMDRAERRARAKGGSGGYGVPETTRLRWEALKRKVREAAVRETAERDLGDRIARALGRLLGSFDESTTHSLLRDYLSRVCDQKDVGCRLLMVRALRFVPKSRAGSALVYVLRSDRDPRIQVEAVLALGESRSPFGVEVLIDRLGHPLWPVRAAATQALANYGDQAEEAVGPLIGMLEREPGRLREDAAAALAAITGRRLGPFPERWRAWQVATRRGEPYTGPEESAEDAAGATFYGIRTLSRRILFVLDRSGSMRSLANPSDPDRERTKLALMQRELRQTVTSLDDGARLNLIVYNHSVDRFEPKRSLVALEKKVRRAFERYVEKFDAIGATNIHDALEAAFRMAGLGVSDGKYDTAFDTVFFLTDGNPTAGKILSTDHIRSEVRRWNGLRRIKIHVIAVGSDLNESFLRALAKDSGGQFVRR